MFFFPEKNKNQPEKIFNILPEKFLKCPRKNLENCPRNQKIAREKNSKIQPEKKKSCPRKKCEIVPEKIQKVPEKKIVFKISSMSFFHAFSARRVPVIVILSNFFQAYVRLYYSYLCPILSSPAASLYFYDFFSIFSCLRRTCSIVIL